MSPLRPSSTEMFVKEGDNTRVEVAVKGRSIEARRIAAKARQARRELRRTGWQKSEVAGRHGMNVRLARQADGNAPGACRIHASAAQFGPPELQRDGDD